VQLEEIGHVRQENKRLGRRPIVPLQRGLLVRDKALLLAELSVKPQYRPELAKLMASSVLRADPKRGTAIGARFGEHLTLVSAQVTPARVRRLSAVSVTTVWRVDGEQRGPAQIAVEIASRIPGYGLRELHPPLDGIHPIRNWAPGTFVVDTHAIQMPELMPTGDATLYVGVGIQDDRLPGVDARGAPLPVGGVQVGKISVAK
jgi:hypothetical protein